MSGLRVLMYHKVSESETDYLTVSTQQLRNQLTWLKEGYNFITLNDLSQFIIIGKALPKNPLLITFDDGYLNNFTLAYPIFKSLKIPFSIFLVSDYINNKVLHDNKEQYFLNEAQLREMQDYVQYGFHSKQHNSLMDLDFNLWETEIKKCISDFKTKSIHMEPAWAYTYGAFPKKNKVQLEHLKKIFKNVGIHYAFRIGNRINQTKLKEPYAIQRIDVRGNESFLKFKLKVLFGKLF